MIKEQAAAATSQGKSGKKRTVYVKPCFKRRKNLELYRTLFAELWLEYHPITNDFWELWRNISADKRRHTLTEH